MMKWWKDLYHSASQRVMSFTFAGMVLKLLLNMLIAARLGAGEATDGLVIALSVPLFIDTVTRGGTSFSMVPLLIEAREKLPDEGFRRFVSSLLNGALVVGLIMTAVVIAGSPVLVGVLAPGMGSDARAETVVLMRACAPMVLFVLGTAMFSVLLNSERRFSLVALRSSLGPLIVIAAMGLVWKSREVALWTALAYSLGQAFLLAVLWKGAQSVGFRHDWRAWLTHEDWHRVRDSIAMPSLGFVVRNSSRFVERSLASLAGPGSIAVYYFAFNAFSATQTLVGSSLATTALPSMVKAGLAGDKGRLTRMVRVRLKRILLICSPLVLGILVLHRDLIRLLYGYGHFGTEAVLQTSNVLFWFALGIIPLCMIPMLQSVLYAQKAYTKVFCNMLAMAGLNVFLAWTLFHWHGVVGLALAVSLTAIASCLSLGLLLRFMDPREGARAVEDGENECETQHIAG